MKRIVGLGASVVVLLAVASPAWALITKLTPLADILDESEYVVTATVDKLDAERPSMVLKFDEKLKGKPPFPSLAVLLKGDADAIKAKEPPQLLERLAVKLTVVVFLHKEEDEYVGFVYTNGTWFRIIGVKSGKDWAWSFAHFEPYLRKTYRGSTKEMIQTVKDSLADRKKAPKPDDTVEKGIGPKVQTKTSFDEDEGPRFGLVMPVLFGGPLLMLAMLFPTAFGGWRRFFVLISTVGTNCTLFSLHWYFGEYLAGKWWGNPVVLWAVMGVFNVLGIVWAWRRHLALAQAGEAPGRPGAIEVLVLCVLSAVGVASLVTLRFLQQDLFSTEWLPAVAFCAAIWIGCGYAIYARLRPLGMEPAVSTEAVVLTGLVLVSLLLGTTLQPARASAGGDGVRTVKGETQEAKGEQVTIAWKFRVPGKGSLASSPLVVEDRVFIAAAHEGAFVSYGAVYCLDRGTGEQLWAFSNKRKMKPVYSTPVLSGGKLYVGEGFHTDSACRVYCLDAEKGTKLWDFATANHTESTPVVVDGRVYVGAGDDGVYCLDAEKGTQVWNFPGFHVDAPPRVVGGRVYAGCGVGDEFRETALFCLAAKDGKSVWRMSTALPVWGRPIVSGGFVYVGCGNGRVNQAAADPAGEMLCLREKDGEVVWSKKFADGILASPVADRRHVYFGCRDGGLYALRRKDGSLAWRADMGSPVVTTPAVEGAGEEAPAGRLYAAAFDGRLACVDSRAGKLLWERELSAVANAPVEVISSPALEAGRDADGSEVWRLYVGVTLISTGRVGELICFEDRTQAQE